MRTRARARLENITPSDAASKDSAKTSRASLPSNPNHYKATKAARRRDTFSIVQGGHERRILADRTRFHVNAAAARHAKAERRKTMEFYPLVLQVTPDGAASSAGKSTDGKPPPQEGIPTPRCKTPRTVRWAKRIEVFERSPDERSERDSSESTPRHREPTYREASPETESLTVTTESTFPHTAQGSTCMRVAHAYIGKTPPRATMRSRPRSSSPKGPVPATGNSRSGIISLNAVSAAKDDLRASSSGMLVKSPAAEGSSDRALKSVIPGAVASSAVHTPLPRRSAAGSPGQPGGHWITFRRPALPAHSSASAASGSCTSSASSGSDDTTSISTAARSLTSEPAPWDHSSSAPLGSRGSQLISWIDRWILCFGAVYAAFISAMFARMFGVW
ncbi:hypothetical protein BV20DRAFT_1118533 [Pilatotrama ljubarskyi]|nr:hypothetical protein BV20DRAFT_1118533 [Pilatotrama ljubarskyi]